MDNGLILKGDQIVVPESMQIYMLSKLHEEHQGIEKQNKTKQNKKQKKLRAKDCIYWVNINQDIEALVKDCSVCQEYQKSEPKKP